jgi:hypothetical protein
MSSSYKVSYVGDGTTTNYAVVPDYIRKNHIFVTLDGVSTSAYTFFNDQTIQFNVAPGLGVVIEIVRRPPGDIPLNTFTGTVITPTSLNENFRQAAQLGTIFQDDAETAVNTSNAAIAAIASAVIYQPVVDLTALNLLTPDDGEYFELQDSTGANSDPSITGIPGGLTGGSGLVFRLRYDDPPGEYVFLGYFAGDSETRYLKTGTGTVTSTNIVDGTIVNADVNASAAIAGTKISPDFGSQNVVTTGTSTAAQFIPTGSSVPANGVYLPGANEVGVATNTTERARIDSSGRLLVGTSTARGNFFNATSQETKFQVEGTDVRTSSSALIRNSDSNGGAFQVFAKSRGTTVGSNTVVLSGDRMGNISFQGSDGTEFVEAVRISAEVDGTPGADDMPGRLVFSTTADGASSPTERFAICEDGRVTTNRAFTTTGSGSEDGFTVLTSDILLISRDNGAPLSLRRRSTNGNIVSFRRDTGSVGDISVTTTATAYNTSSDYRLKENVVPLTGAIDRLQQIPVHRFNFIADPDTVVDGFIAHEAQEIVPECVTGTKDEVDEEGNPVYQGIDQSKLVPLLTAALQEAIGRIEALEAEVQQLKG